MIEWADFERLILELIGSQKDEIEVREWASAHNINPDALFELISTLTWNIKEEFMNEATEKATPEGVTEDGTIIAHASMDLATLLGSVAFQAFVFAWEAAIQLSGADKSG